MASRGPKLTPFPQGPALIAVVAASLGTAACNTDKTNSTGGASEGGSATETDSGVAPMIPPDTATSASQSDTAPMVPPDTSGTTTGGATGFETAEPMVPPGTTGGTTGTTSDGTTSDGTDGSTSVGEDSGPIPPMPPPPMPPGK